MEEKYFKSEGVKVVCLFGESGSGKSTTIRNTRQSICGYSIKPNTVIIRNLLEKNSYHNRPKEQLVNKMWVHPEDMDEESRAKRIEEIYAKYVNSQHQLLNDWSSELLKDYMSKDADYKLSGRTAKFLLIVDRSPVDFYVMTKCGLDYLKEALGVECNEACRQTVERMRLTAQKNTKNYVNAIVITEPWSSGDSKKLNDGVRDEFLDPMYRSTNWYGRFAEAGVEAPTYVINGSVTDLAKRASVLDGYLENILCNANTN